MNDVGEMAIKREEVKREIKVLERNVKIRLIEIGAIDLLSVKWEYILPRKDKEHENKRA